MEAKALLDNLFHEWKERTLIVGRGSSKTESKVFCNDFYSDGIVNEDAWNTSTIKILYILKEVHDCASDTSECDFLTSDDILRGYQESSNMWRKIAYLANGILNAATSDKTPVTLLDMKEESYYTEAINRIAIMNLKKCAGGATVGSVKSKEKGTYVAHAKAFADLIAKEIEIISPNIIVCCNTFDECAKYIFTPKSANPNSGYYFLEIPSNERFAISSLNNGCLVFNNYHPSAWEWTVKKEMYFDPIVERSAKLFEK